MSDTRTSAQKAADDALLEAIQNVVRLQDGPGDDNDVVVEYVVVARCDGFGLQERGASAYSIISKDSGQGPLASSHHSVLGLLHYGIDYLRSDM